MKVLDVALQTNEVLFETPAYIRDREQPQKEPFQLDEEVWVGRLDLDLAWKVIESCEAPGFWAGTHPTRQYAPLYAFVRELKQPENDLHWDNDQKLRIA